MAKEYIERDALIEDFKSCGAVKELIDAIIFRIYMNPTADVVEVVRCKDCIHRVYVDMGDDIGAIGGCELFGQAMSCVDFCSYGERRDNDD